MHSLHSIELIWTPAAVELSASWPPRNSIWRKHRLVPPPQTTFTLPELRSAPRVIVIYTDAGMDLQLLRSPATAADYGYDAPYALVIFAVIGAAGTFGAIVAWRGGDRHLTAVMSFYAVFFLGNALSFSYATRRGKFVVWNNSSTGYVSAAMSASSTWAVAAARSRRRRKAADVRPRHRHRSLEHARSVRQCQRRHAAQCLAGGGPRSRRYRDRRHARAALCRWLLRSRRLESRHPQHSWERRPRRAVSEAWRVLKPGGRLVIADIRATALYARTLDALGATTTRRRLGWRFWYGNPFAATSLVTATEPLS